MKNYGGKRMLTIVQGDTLIADFDFNSDQDIAHVYFSSKVLNIQKECEQRTNNSGVWTVTLSPETTKTLRVGTYSYDITVHFANDDVWTIVYNGELVVKRKVNVVEISSGE